MTMPKDVSGFACEVVLRDGSTLRLRPIQPADAPALLELHERLSDQSRYFRFFTVPRLDLARAVQLATVDSQNEVALVGESGGRIIAAVRYIRDPKPDLMRAGFQAVCKISWLSGGRRGDVSAQPAEIPPAAELNF